MVGRPGGKLLKTLEYDNTTNSHEMIAWDYMCIVYVVYEYTYTLYSI